MKKDIIVISVTAVMVVTSIILGLTYQKRSIEILKHEQQMEEIERKAQIERQREEEKIERQKNCEMMAILNYSADWENECISQGLGEDCRLPSYNADILNNSLKQDKDRCFK